MASARGSYKKKFAKRANFLIFLVCLLSVLICGRLFILTVVRHEFYLSKTNIQRSSAQAQNIKRGEIYLQTIEGVKHPLAVNKARPMAYVEPQNLDKENNLSALADELADILSLDKKEVLDKITDKDDSFKILKRQISEEEVKKIKEINIRGTGIKMEENLRYYPNQKLASHIVGFLGYRGDDRAGQYGIEEYYDNVLSGREEFYRNAEADLASEESPERKDIILTIDPNIQLFVEEGLQKTIEQYDATGGTAIVMNPKNGKLMAMANYPDFNPNKYEEVTDFQTFINDAISSVFEPGSVYKPIIMAVGLNEGKITPNSTYEDKGFVNIYGETIYNADRKTYGIQTMTQVLEESINTGVIHVQKKLDNEVFKKYIKDFGFGKKTDINLPGEVSGNITNLESGRPINFATASFGQGISVTPIQLARAIGAIANKGLLVKPQIVEYQQENGNISIDPDRKTISKRVISADTANRLTSMLVSVTENGTGKMAKLDDYWVAVKTGTAQIPTNKKEGYGEETIHTIVGFAPAYDAEFTILIKLDRPKGVRFSAMSVAPLFKDITEYLFNYLEIPPQK